MWPRYIRSPILPPESRSAVLPLLVSHTDTLLSRSSHQNSVPQRSAYGHLRSELLFSGQRLGERLGKTHALQRTSSPIRANAVAQLIDVRNDHLPELDLYRAHPGIHAYSRRSMVTGIGTIPKTIPNSTSTSPSVPFTHRRSSSGLFSRKGSNRAEASSSMPCTTRSGSLVPLRQES